MLCAVQRRGVARDLIVASAAEPIALRDMGSFHVGGRVIEMAETEYMVRGQGYLRSKRDLEMLVVKMEGGTWKEAFEVWPAALCAGGLPLWRCQTGFSRLSAWFVSAWYLRRNSR